MGIKIEIQIYMATRRMVQKSYSYSKEINSLSDFAARLFLMIIPHLDDFGRIDGDSEVLKAMVMPLRVFTPVEEFDKALRDITSLGLIERYVVGGNQVIRYPNFEFEQTGLSKRTASRYPDPPSDNSIKFTEIQRTSKSSEENRTEVNISEENVTKENFQENNIAIKKSLANNLIRVNPKTFKPGTADEAAAFEAWQILEPKNPFSLSSTYLKAIQRGVSADLIRQFVSEIKHDQKIVNRGAVFNTKVDDYLKEKSNET